MSGRLSKPRQEPLDPDETFSALVTRLIITNRTERASSDQAHDAPRLSLAEASSDRVSEPRSHSGAQS